MPMSSRISLLCLLFVFSASNALSQDVPALAGYVTHVASSTDFDVNGIHVLCNNSTTFGTESNGVISSSKTPIDLHLGEAIKIFGVEHQKKHSITAANVVTPLPQPDQQFDGTAIIDLIPQTNSLPKISPGELLVRADGYLILITPKTHTKFEAPLNSLSSITTNTWISYQGKRRQDGILLAENADFKSNSIQKTEDKLRTGSEYDPKAVDPNSKQSAISKHFLGTNVKKIPPYTDPVMQARIDRIGTSLIPAYQRNLPDSDPTKINFRFQLIDAPKWHDAMTLPNGIILVPREVVERLQNDSQLATVLADNIACAIEKQSYREIPAGQKMLATEIAGATGSAFVPGLGIATTIANDKAAATILRHTEEQSGRVSLGFLHDAGYDIYEAPKTWWLLAPNKTKDISDISLPERAAYLYSVIGESWHTDLPQPLATTNLLSSSSSQ